MEKKVNIHYYAILREQCGIEDETVKTKASTASDLYREIAGRHGFSLKPEQIKVAVNAEFCDPSVALNEGDTVVFVPPVAGG